MGPYSVSEDKSALSGTSIIRTIRNPKFGPIQMLCVQIYLVRDFYMMFHCKQVQYGKNDAVKT